MLRTRMRIGRGFKYNRGFYADIFGVNLRVNLRYISVLARSARVTVCFLQNEPTSLCILLD